MTDPIEKLRNTDDPRDKLRVWEEYRGYRNPLHDSVLGSVAGTMYFKTEDGYSRYSRDCVHNMVFMLVLKDGRIELHNDEAEVKIKITRPMIITHTVLDVFFTQKQADSLNLDKLNFRVEVPIYAGTGSTLSVDGGTVTVQRPEEGWLHVEKN